jgi:hypothetical protein
MRTTIDIPDEIDPILRRVARDRGTSLSQVVGALLTQALSAVNEPAPARFGVSSAGFPTIRSGNRVITSEDVRALEDEV